MVIKDKSAAIGGNKMPVVRMTVVEKALRYIDAHLSDDSSWRMSSHVYLSPYYFSKPFKKYQGIDLMRGEPPEKWLAPENCFCHSDWSIASIARNSRLFANQLFL